MFKRDRGNSPTSRDAGAILFTYQPQLLRNHFVSVARSELSPTSDDVKKLIDSPDTLTPAVRHKEYEIIKEGQEDGTFYRVFQIYSASKYMYAMRHISYFQYAMRRYIVKHFHFQTSAVAASTTSSIP